jgi:CIC family chloride channel protein
MELGRLVLLISKEKNNVFPVVDGQEKLIGVINLVNIRKVVFRQELYRVFHAGQLMEEPPARLNINDPMGVVMDKFEETGASSLPVLKDDGTFVGFISKTKLYSHYRQILVDYSEE